MNELKRIAADIESAFDASGYPREFLAAFDQLECLASHAGRETFLVQPKGDGALAVATCYDRTVLPFHPDIGLLQGLEHPGLPRYLAVYQNDQTLCVVRSYIEGSTLADWAGERQLGLQEIAALGIKLCDILEALHTHVPPVVHRDIKPENIIVRPDGSLALIDLDIARAVRGDAGSDTVCFGTRGYAPPEQYGFGQTDPRSDIYALGVLLRWLVTGSTRLNANIAFDPALTHIIARCTAFSPSDRYADIGQVRRALTGVGRRRLRIRPRALVLGLLAALMLLCAGFAAGRFTDWFRPVEKLTFEEPLIERAARLWIGKERGPLTPEDLAQVTRLYIYGTEAFGEPEPFYQCSIDRSVVGPIRTLDDLSRLPNLEELHIAYLQSRFALERAFQLGGERWAIPFSDCALEYMLGRTREAMPLRHLVAPELNRLIEYDRQKGTQYYGTLRAYLLNERDIPRTSQALIIHRTTLLYRLRKLQTLAPIDLDDPGGRLQLLISLWILDHQG